MTRRTELSDRYLERMAGVLRVLAHAYRLRVVEFLEGAGASPVHRIGEELGGTQGALSQHLNKMRAAGLIRAERRGKEVWYEVSEPDALTILNCMRKRCERESAR